jgi:hypothetical protein
MREAYVRKSKLGFGFALICVFFIVETVNADRLMSNPASPYVWALLGLGAIGFSAYALHCRRMAKRL